MQFEGKTLGRPNEWAFVKVGSALSVEEVRSLPLRPHNEQVIKNLKRQSGDHGSLAPLRFLLFVGNKIGMGYLAEITMNHED